MKINGTAALCENNWVRVNVIVLATYAMYLNDFFSSVSSDKMRTKQVVLLKILTAFLPVETFLVRYPVCQFLKLILWKKNNKFPVSRLQNDSHQRPGSG